MFVCVYSDAELDRKKGERGPGCWALGFCTAEIVDAVVRNTKVVLPVSTYIHVSDVINVSPRRRANFNGSSYVHRERDNEQRDESINDLIRE